MNVNEAIKTQERRFLCVRINTSILYFLHVYIKRLGKLIGYAPAKY